MCWVMLADVHCSVQELPARSPLRTTEDKSMQRGLISEVLAIPLIHLLRSVGVRNLASNCSSRHASWRATHAADITDKDNKRLRHTLASFSGLPRPRRSVLTPREIHRPPLTCFTSDISSQSSLS